jgi:flagellar hook-associated protein 3 FlgL
MRVTTNSLYSKFIYDQQTTYSNLNKVTDQISNGMKISKMNDDPKIFTDTLRLDNESNTLTQVVNTSKTAQTFANNTDTTMNDMMTTLTSFKTTLLQAASAVNNNTSSSALADELDGLKKHLQQLANTSIDGKFLFAGTAFDTKPIDDAGNYHGNDKHIKAKLGSLVEQEYNIDGATLFQGIDKDYSKHIQTNVKHFDALKEHPAFVVLKNGKYYIDKNIKADNQTAATDDYPKQVSLSTDSEIRQLTGVSDIYDSATDSYTDGTSYFYIKGRKPTGETFSEKFSLTNSAKIDDLLNKIGKAFGNNAVTKAVDVSMNQFGQISIKDATTGKMVTDFSMVASNTDESSVDDIVKNGDYAVSFTKSNFSPLRDLSEVSAHNKNFDNSIFSLDSEFRTIDKEKFAKPTNKVHNVLNYKISSIHLSGKDTSGNDVDETFNIDDDTTMQDLMDNIKNNFGDVEVSLDNGKLYIKDNTIDKDEKSNLEFKMDDAKDDNGNSIENVFSRMDGLTNDKTNFKTDGRKLISNVAQIDKNSQLPATEETELIDVSGKDDIDGKKLELNYTDKNGNIKQATITLRDTADSNGHLSTFTVDGHTYDILDNKGDKTPIHDKTTITQELDPQTCKLCNTEHTTKGMSYKQLSDVVGMLMSGNLPADDKFTSYKTAVSKSREDINVGLQDGKLFIEDKKNAVINMKFEMHDSDTDSYDGSRPLFTFNSNNAITVDKPKVDIFHQLDNIIKSVREGKMRADADSFDPRNAGIENGIELIDHIFDHVNKNHTKIGAISRSLEHTQQRNEILVTHVETLKSDVIDVDMAGASMQLQKLQLNYQAMLATISKVNGLSLVNYMR